MESLGLPMQQLFGNSAWEERGQHDRCAAAWRHQQIRPSRCLVKSSAAISVDATDHVSRPPQCLLRVRYCALAARCWIGFNRGQSRQRRRRRPVPPPHTALPENRPDVDPFEHLALCRQRHAWVANRRARSRRAAVKASSLLAVHIQLPGALLPRIKSDALSAIIMVEALRLAEIIRGMIEASITRRPCSPWTRS